MGLVGAVEGAGTLAGAAPSRARIARSRAAASAVMFETVPPLVNAPAAAG